MTKKTQQLVLLLALVIAVSCWAGSVLGGFLADLETSKSAKIWGVVGISLCIGLVLFGLFMTMAKNKAWGTRVVLWTCLAAVLAGIGVQAKSLFLAVTIGIAMGIGYLGWMLLGRFCRGSKLHVLRALWFSLCLGPFAAFPAYLLGAYAQWLTGDLLAWLDGYQADFLWWHLLHGIPGFVLAGGIAYAVSRLTDRQEGDRRDAKLSRLRGILVSGVRITYVLVMLWCMNWYYAGKYDIHDLVTPTGNSVHLHYVLLSRPGSANTHSGWDRPISRCDGNAALTLLLAHGANPDQPPPDYMRHRGYPLAWAADVQRVRLLLEAGANPNMRSGPDDATPLEVLAGWGSTEVDQLLMRYGGKAPSMRWTALHFAAVAEAVDLIELCVARGDSVTVGAPYGKTPLYYAVKARNMEAVRLLVQADPDKGHRETKSIGFLHLAADAGDAALIKAFLDGGAPIDARDPGGWTPLHYAMAARSYHRMLNPPPHRKEFDAIIELLLNRGADVNAKAADGMTPKDIEENWPSRFEGTGFGRFAEEERRPTTSKIRELLKRVIIEKVFFEDASVGTVVEFLEKQCRELDEDGVGFPIILARIGPKPEREDSDRAAPTITMDFDNLPLGEAIRYICEGAGFRYKVGRNALLIQSPHTVEEPMQLIAVDYLPEDETKEFNRDPQAYFKDQGISFLKAHNGDHARLSIDLLNHRIVMRNAAPDRRWLETMYRVIDGDPRRHKAPPVLPPLLIAVYFHDRELIEAVLKKGANINKRDLNGFTPSDWVHTEEIRKLLRKHGAKTSAELYGRP